MRASRVYWGRLRRRAHGSGNFLMQQLPGERAATPTTFSLTDAEKATNALAHRLLERHRQRHAAHLHEEVTASCGNIALVVASHQPQEEMEEGPLRKALARHKRRHTVDALAGYGKTAVLANLAHSMDARLAETRDLVEATEREWETLTTRNKMSVACTEAGNRPVVRAWVRYSRTNSSVSFPTKFTERFTPFDAVMQRYCTVVPHRGPRVATVDAALGWRVNMPASLTQRGALRCVLARKEQLSRQNEWRRIRGRQLPLGTDGGGVGTTMQDEKGRQVESASAGRVFGGRPFASPVFRRYCLQFGSSTLQRMAFLTDPALYFVLCNWSLTGTESLLEVRQKAEALSHQYACPTPLS
ncbi:hypothetical protein TraAM80_09013 [Trypanosoma rangeli]|uniref:Uncharacterized protein n=1 Tax=Trypanosoma rangeli TaxID=5698 RepID=A0A3R7LIR7_TRYRA|nr:uncharacterized protein TraAM80_09013 [Trypanosoma rangeli]RNE98026.1 hypothetical protein TraAM80_09013 [Trypanosoma rangeli]|eukprot:RNE98026.1 hypothetical protein TraAM80_09013 [Trypanosoma rangeli]